MAEIADPWEYFKTEDDWKRKAIILSVVALFANPDKVHRVLDIGAGNGFISNDIPGVEQIEIDKPMAKNLKNRVKEPRGKYDIVLATGVLYGQYDYQQMRGWIEKHASNIVLTSHYDKVGKAHDKFDKPQVFYAEFPYRDGKQILRVYKWV